MAWRWGLVGLVGLSVAGCSEPTQLVPVGPPGIEFVKVPPPADGEGAQALGEQAVQASAGDASQASEKRKQALQVTPTKPAESTKIGAPATTDVGLVYETLKEGTGEPIKSGQTAVVHYTGTLTDGSKFDSSRDRNAPFRVTLGIGAVIKGWDLEIPGMKVGEVRKITIPPELGYGPNGQGGVIPPNATLVFEVELVGIE